MLDSKPYQAIPSGERWWGRLTISENVWCAWKISLLQFYLKRSNNEWNFSWYQDQEPSDPIINMDLSGNSVPNLKQAEHSRFVHSAADIHFDLGLALADRPMVARPETSISVSPNQRATIYVSSGLWLQPKLNGHVLMDMPIYRPSDTWFGENTREGEMCYFSRTRARTQAVNDISAPHRVVTPITITNRGAKTVRIERLRVPVVNLGLYINESKEFVTNSLSMILHESAAEVSMEIVPITRQQREFELISPPRIESDSGLLDQAIAKFLG